ncbi:hypothetical protein BRADI_2g37707v3 [Brachypodium distachyon]|uniref:Uncharacterized protein n=1 Tax=Brachypodium distachyon TaxID=15368 RepID=A0A2K2DCC7_BRADI|nr:hypothetical protein BRADI_2g37707v3 [Brachypodium distachyon]
MRGYLPLGLIGHFVFGFSFLSPPLLYEGGGGGIGFAPPPLSDPPRPCRARSRRIRRPHPSWLGAPRAAPSAVLGPCVSGMMGAAACARGVFDGMPGPRPRAAVPDRPRRVPVRGAELAAPWWTLAGSRFDHVGLLCMSCTGRVGGSSSKAGHYYASLDLKKATWQYDTDVEFVYS